MADEEIQPFRLLDLPGEIRNKIYQEVLCSFDSAPIRPSANALLQNHDSSQTGLCTVTHSIETAVLLTSKQVHREAYDVMVKRNQFIKVTTIDVPMSSLLLPFQVPIVTLDRAHTEQFHGYVISLSMSAIIGGWVDEPLDSDDEGGMGNRGVGYHAPPAGTGPRFNFMVLGRDWEALCYMLSWADACIEGFSWAVKIVLHLNPYATEPDDSSAYKASIADFFTTKNQETLLNPFRNQVSGLTAVTVTGAVDVDLAQSVVVQVHAPLYTDSREALRDLNATKASANALYTAQNFTAATAEWSTAIMKLNRVYKSASWPGLLEDGGPEFATSLEECYFTTSLDRTQGKLRAMQVPNTSPATIVALGWEAVRAWEEYSVMGKKLKYNGSSYEPPTDLQIKCSYLHALCWRLMGSATDNPEVVRDALRSAAGLIVEALRLAPHDPVVAFEGKLIMAWMREQVATHH
jgi:hypothetical protein